VEAQSAPALQEQALEGQAPPEPERKGVIPAIDVRGQQPVARRSCRSFTFTEVIVLNLGVAAMFALLLVTAGIAFRVAEEPAVFTQPLSVMTNKMSLLVEARSATPTSSPPALAAASALRISLKAHRAAQATAAVAYAETAETQGQAGEVSATNRLATATPVPATQAPVPATVAPTLPPTFESVPQPIATPVPLQPTPTPVPPAFTQTSVPSRGAASQLVAVPAAGASPPIRITISRIGLDVPVRPVGMISYEVAGETRYIWDTLPDTAAFHETSAYPGLPGNTVINGHRDIGAAVFRDLGEIQVGDAIQVFVNEAVGYVYQVEEILVVPHTHASQEQHATNRKLLGYFPEVRLTLVTCEPIGSASHRLVIIARPPAAQSEGTSP
jgi:sortase A